MKELSNIIVHSSNNGISRIKLNEPSTYNALSLKTLKSLIESFKNFNEDEKTKLMCLSGVKQYPMRVKCATLSWHTLSSALDNSQETVKTEI